MLLLELRHAHAAIERARLLAKGSYSEHEVSVLVSVSGRTLEMCEWRIGVMEKFGTKESLE
jgi:hypothetical protein